MDFGDNPSSSTSSSSTSIPVLICPIPNCKREMRRYDFKELGLHFRRAHPSSLISQLNSNGVSGFYNCGNCKTIHHASVICKSYRPSSDNIESSDLNFGAIYARPCVDFPSPRNCSSVHPSPSKENQKSQLGDRTLLRTKSDSSND